MAGVSKQILKGAGGVVRRGMHSGADKAKLFDHGAVYASYRPTYPDSLYDEIHKYSGKSWRGGVAMDVAAGTGQATFALANRFGFDKVLAVDGSASQVASGQELCDSKAMGGDVAASRVEFCVGSAEKLPSEDSSVSLVTVAQALHWFDLNLFYKEAFRVLEPGGTLAIWGYDMAVLDNADAMEIVNEFYGEKLGDEYWDDRRKLVESHLKGMAPSETLESSPFLHETRLELTSPLSISVTHLIGYISSWSAYQTFMKRNGLERNTDQDPLLTIEAKLRSAYGASDDTPSSSISVTGHTPIFVILAKKPE